MEFRHFMNRCKKSTFKRIMAMTMVIAMAASSLTGCAAAVKASQADTSQAAAQDSSADQSETDAGTEGAGGAGAEADPESILSREMLETASIKGSSRTSVGKS